MEEAADSWSSCKCSETTSLGENVWKVGIQDPGPKSLARETEGGEEGGNSAHILVVEGTHQFDLNDCNLEAQFYGVKIFKNRVCYDLPTFRFVTLRRCTLMRVRLHLFPASVRGLLHNKHAQKKGRQGSRARTGSDRARAETRHTPVVLNRHKTAGLHEIVVLFVPLQAAEEHTSVFCPGHQ